MAYGTQISRGVLGDPSSQARGRRTPEMTKEQRERKEKKKEQKPPKDVPLRKWKSHRKALGDMKDSLKDLKKQIRDADDPKEKNELRMRWEAGFDEYDVTKKQLQEVRNQYQASWQEQVGVMEEDIDDVQRTDKRRLLKRYTDGVDTYRDFREESIELESWEPGLGAPMFNWLQQDLNKGETVTRGDGSEVKQWTFNAPKRGQATTLDKMPTVIDPKGYKFYEQSFTSFDGKVEEGGMTEFIPPLETPFNEEEISDRVEKGVEVTTPELGSTMPRKGGLQGAPGLLTNEAKDGMSTAKRKKYDIDGNRIE